MYALRGVEAEVESGERTSVRRGQSSGQLQEGENLKRGDDCSACYVRVEDGGVELLAVTEGEGGGGEVEA